MSETKLAISASFKKVFFYNSLRYPEVNGIDKLGNKERTSNETRISSYRRETSVIFWVNSDEFLTLKQNSAIGRFSNSFVNHFAELCVEDPIGETIGRIDWLVCKFLVNNPYPKSVFKWNTFPESHRYWDREKYQNSIHVSTDWFLRSNDCDDWFSIIFLWIFREISNVFWVVWIFCQSWHVQLFKLILMW